MTGPEVLLVEERIEDERFLSAFGRRRGRIGSVVRIEHARLGRGFGFAVGRRSSHGAIGAIGRSGGRRQIERPLATAAGERKRDHAKENDGPSRCCRAQLIDHDEIPKSGRTIQRLPWEGERKRSRKLQRNWFVQPNFRCFSSRFAQALACAATFFGAVPPKLVRLFTEASTESAFSASAVMSGSTSCIAFSGNSCSATPCFEASATMRPVTWWASRNGIFSVRTSQSARSVAVA